MLDIQEDNIKIYSEIFMVALRNSSLLVQEVNHTRLCAFCGSDLNVEEGVMIYDKNWYHNGCWNSFENEKEVKGND